MTGSLRKFTHHPDVGDVALKVSRLTMSLSTGPSRIDASSCEISFRHRGNPSATCLDEARKSRNSHQLARLLGLNRWRYDVASQLLRVGSQAYFKRRDVVSGNTHVETRSVRNVEVNHAVATKRKEREREKETQADTFWLSSSMTIKKYPHNSSPRRWNIIRGIRENSSLARGILSTRPAEQKRFFFSFSFSPNEKRYKFGGWVNARVYRFVARYLLKRQSLRSKCVSIGAIAGTGWYRAADK